MDLRTGRIYDSKEAAVAAGVLESDLIEMTSELVRAATRRGSPPIGRNATRSKAYKNKGAREMARRQRQLQTRG